MPDQESVSRSSEYVLPSAVAFHAFTYTDAQKRTFSETSLSDACNPSYSYSRSSTTRYGDQTKIAVKAQIRAAHGGVVDLQQGIVVVVAMLNDDMK
jgi:hypothetical protein